jgi:hypothetical protein
MKFRYCRRQEDSGRENNCQMLGVPLRGVAQILVLRTCAMSHVKCFRLNKYSVTYCWRFWREMALTFYSSIKNKHILL